jgi:hypothetical protein
MSIAPHDMTDKKGYLVNIEVLDFPLEFWCKEHHYNKPSNLLLPK